MQRDILLLSVALAGIVAANGKAVQSLRGTNATQHGASIVENAPANNSTRAQNKNELLTKSLASVYSNYPNYCYATRPRAQLSSPATLAHEKKVNETLAEFRAYVNGETYLKDLMEKSLAELPVVEAALKAQNCPDYPGKELTDNTLPGDVDSLFEGIRLIISSAPQFIDAENPLNGVSLLSVLARFFATNSGMGFMGNTKVNMYMGRILNVWKEFLDSPLSTYVLVPGEGWLAMDTMPLMAHDPAKPHYGFTSWNDFFIRTYADWDKTRPLADTIMVGVADSKLNAVYHDLKYEGLITCKGDIYSISDMLGPVDVDIKKSFVGGSLYQAFLSAENYHRYHSPVEGVIVHASVVPGSYYLMQDQTPCNGPNGNSQCVAQSRYSQQFFANAQVRAVYVIDSPVLGHVAMVAIGMIEVSSCMITDGIKVGVTVKKGQELGYFQFGGSTHVVMVSKAAYDMLNFVIPQQPPWPSSIMKVRGPIANLKTGHR